MAKKFSDVPIWLRVGTGITLFAVVIWGIGKVSGMSKANEVFLLNSHESRITENTQGITSVKKYVTEFKEEVKDRFMANEKMQIVLQKDQQAILSNQTDFKIQQNKHTDLIIKQIEAQAEISAWIKTIEKVE